MPGQSMAAWKPCEDCQRPVSTRKRCDVCKAHLCATCRSEHLIGNVTIPGGCSERMDNLKAQRATK